MTYLQLDKGKGLLHFLNIIVDTDLSFYLPLTPHFNRDVDLRFRILYWLQINYLLKNSKSTYLYVLLYYNHCFLYKR